MRELEMNEMWNRIERLEAAVYGLRREIRRIIHYLRCHRPPPAAPTLAGTFDTSGALMNAVLVATIPSTRKDGSALAPTDIASITFQKTALEPDGVTPGPEQPLQTNGAVAGAGLTPADLTFTDPNAVAGDSYTCFVTDTAGDVGDLSNAEVAPAPLPLSAPSAPTLTATFT